jgi:hypothetical protein
MAGRENIKKWAMRKLGLSEKEAESASWGIIKTIQREGSEAKPFLRNAVQEAIK